MPYTASMSEHLDAAVAVGETVGHVLETLGSEPDIAVVFVSAHHIGQFDNLVGAVQATLRPGCLIASTAVSVLADAREVEARPALAVWAGVTTGEQRAVRITATPDGKGTFDFEGLDLSSLEAEQGACLLIVADPFTFPIDDAIQSWADQYPDMAVIGGLASAAHSPGGNRLAFAGADPTAEGAARTHRDGAVGCVLTGTTVTSLVSQGCRPIGTPQVITRSSGNLIEELAGRSAINSLQTTFDGLSLRDKSLANQGLHIGRVVDEYKVDFRRGDFIIRAVMGANQASGAVAIGEAARVGTTVQFQVRDALTADEDLLALIAGVQDPVAGALVFTCNGRGTHLFPEPHHDAAAISEMVGRPAVAGMFCAGEIGPIGGRAFVHGFTASVAMFHD